MVKYWLRLHDDSCGDSLLKEALKDYLHLFNNGQDCLVKCLNTILKAINMMYIFYNPKSCKPKDVALLKRHLQQQFRNKWCTEIKNSDKLRTYREFKCQFQCEPYLEHVVNPKLRQSLTRLRVSCPKLVIETGRYCIPKISAEERLSKCCNFQLVEDEMHLVSVCPFHRQNKEMLYDIAAKECKVFSNLRNRNKFLWLLTNENKDICLQLASFVHKSFMQRLENV